MSRKQERKSGSNKKVTTKSTPKTQPKQAPKQAPKQERKQEPKKAELTSKFNAKLKKMVSDNKFTREEAKELKDLAGDLNYNDDKLQKTLNSQFDNKPDLKIQRQAASVVGKRLKINSDGDYATQKGEQFYRDGTKYGETPKPSGAFPGQTDTSAPGVTAPGRPVQPRPTVGDTVLQLDRNPNETRGGGPGGTPNALGTVDLQGQERPSQETEPAEVADNVIGDLDPKDLDQKIYKHLIGKEDGALTQKLAYYQDTLNSQDYLRQLKDSATQRMSIGRLKGGRLTNAELEKTSYGNLTSNAQKYDKDQARLIDSLRRPLTNYISNQTNQKDGLNMFQRVEGGGYEIKFSQDKLNKFSDLGKLGNIARRKAESLGVKNTGANRIENTLASIGNVKEVRSEDLKKDFNQNLKFVK